MNVLTMITKTRIDIAITGPMNTKLSSVVSVVGIAVIDESGKFLIELVVSNDAIEAVETMVGSMLLSIDEEDGMGTGLVCCVNCVEGVAVLIMDLSTV